MLYTYGNSDSPAAPRRSPTQSSSPLPPSWRIVKTQRESEMLGDVLDAAGGVLKFIGRLALEGFIEIPVKRTGYFLCYPFHRRVDPDGWLVTFIGSVFWIVLIGFAIFAVY